MNQKMFNVHLLKILLQLKIHLQMLNRLVLIVKYDQLQLLKMNKLFLNVNIFVILLQLEFLYESEESDGLICEACEVTAIGVRLLNHPNITSMIKPNVKRI